MIEDQSQLERADARILAAATAALHRAYRRRRIARGIGAIVVLAAATALWYATLPAPFRAAGAILTALLAAFVVLVAFTQPRREDGGFAVYRHSNSGYLSGVCSGLAAAWHAAPWNVRLVFAMLSVAGGFGLVIYLGLGIVLPIRSAPAAEALRVDQVEAEWEELRQC